MIWTTYKKNCNPCEADVVKRDGPAEGVHLPGLAVGVVKVPVYAVCLVEEAGFEVGHALKAVVCDKGGQGVALVHAGAVLRGTDKLLVGVVLEVQRVELTPAKKTKVISSKPF